MSRSPSEAPLIEKAARPQDLADGERTLQDGDPAAPGRTVGRRSVLKGIGVAGAAVVVAGAGVTTYRAFDNGVFDSGAGEPYDAWTTWRSDPGPLGVVAAGILAANPHNTQP